MKSVGDSLPIIAATIGGAFASVGWMFRTWHDPVDVSFWWHAEGARSPTPADQAALVCFAVARAVTVPLVLQAIRRVFK